MDCESSGVGFVGFSGRSVGVGEVEPSVFVVSFSGITLLSPGDEFDEPFGVGDVAPFVVGTFVDEAFVDEAFVVAAFVSVRLEELFPEPVDSYGVF